ncbi:hypothetical protein [Streptomyces sp. NPDC006334]|uniref:hypothetical protein n=1 Tax=Streptomyces sp. NPDC006334 TaxID=3156754 RepID=UPI0033A0315F
MLDNWYFCAALGLSPQDAAAHLDVIAALGEPADADHADDVVCAALDQLGRAGTATALHALPHVLAAHHRFADISREVSDHAGDLYRDLASVVPSEEQHGTANLLRTAAGGATADAAALLDGVLSEASSEADAHSTSAHPYHDLLQHTLPTLALIVARFLARLDPRAVRETVEEHESLVERALAGEHGRLALLQAAELRAALAPDEADQVWEALARASQGALDLEPDLLMTAARVMFAPDIVPHTKGSQVPLETDESEEETGVPDEILDALETEALAGTRLLRRLEEWRSSEAAPTRADTLPVRKAAYARLGGTGAQQHSAMPSVLWQASLWTLSAELAPRATARRLARWWQAPDTPPTKPKQIQNQQPCRISVPYDDYALVQKHVGALHRLRAPHQKPPSLLLTDGPAAETTAHDAASVWSPWIIPPPWTPRAPQGAQADPDSVPGEEERRRREEEENARLRLGGAEPEQLVRLLAAGMLTARLLTVTAGPGPLPDHLLLLVVHIRDIMSRRNALLALAQSDARRYGELTGHLAPLLLHVRSQVDRIGKGQRPMVPPDEIVRVITGLYTAEPDAPGAGALERLLVRNGQALNAALLWVLETSSGGVGLHRTEAGGRWFNGDDPAGALLTLALEKQDHPFTRTAIDAALLRREIYGEERDGLLRWDWEESGPRFLVPPPGDTYTLLPRALVLSGPADEDRDLFSVDEWERMDKGLWDLVAATDTYGVTPITLSTQRLAALLQRPDLGDRGDHEEWVTAWTDLVGSLNSAAHLPRPVRGRMLEMFQSPVRGEGSQQRLLRVLEHVVRAIVDISGRAQFFYERLFEELAAAHLPPESANRLRLLTIRSLYRKWGHGPLAAERGNPFGVYGSRVTARGTELALAQFLRDTADLRVQTTGRSLSAIMTQLWRQSHQPAPLPPHRQDADALTVDPRLVVAATVDRRTGQAVVYRQHVRMDVADAGDKRPTVHDLFATGTDAALPKGGAFVLGTVYAVSDGDTQRNLWINCGLARPVTVELGRSAQDRSWRTGQTLAVLIYPGDTKASQVAPLAAPLPEDGEVRAARIAPADAYPWLRLDVTGAANYDYPMGGSGRDIAARRLWDPDLSRAFADGGGGCVAHTTLAAWDSRVERWLPVDAGLPELAVEAAASGATDEPGRARVRLVFCGHATDRTGFGPAHRFVTLPGRCFVLGPSAWEPSDWEKLEKACLRDPAGLIVHAEFRPGESRLRLAAAPDGGSYFDDRNLRWLAALGTDADTGTGTDTDDESAGDAEPLLAHRVGDDCWQIEVPAVDGFPRQVKADRPNGLPSRHRKSLLCSVQSWREPEARRAVALVEPFQEDGITYDPDVQRYRELARLPLGTTVKLVGTDTKDFQSENRVWLASGLVGFAATDSLTLTGRFPKCTKTTRRQAIVLEDPQPRPLWRPKQTPAPLPPHELAAHCTGLDDPTILDRGDLAGMVAVRIRDDSGRLSHLRVWLNLDTRVVVALVPVECFDHDMPSVGDHVAGQRTARGWTFHVHPRRLKLRALWELKKDRSKHHEWSPVGQYWDGQVFHELYQHSGSALLAQGPAPDLRTAARAQAKAGRRGKGRHQDGAPAVVHHDGHHLVGQASGVDLTEDFQPVRVERTWLEAYGHGDAASQVPAGHLDVRRMFLLSPASRSRSAAPKPAPPRVLDPASEWNLFMAGPAPTVTGSLARNRVEPSAPAPRLAPDDDGRHQPWLALCDEPRTLVAGRALEDYLTDPVRAVPVAHGRGARASFLRVPPVSLAEFMKAVMPRARVDGRRHEIKDQHGRKRRPYYVGATAVGQETVHRFEFGYGWFLDIPGDKLTVGGEPVDPTGITLFHGDRVDAMSFHPGDDPAAPGAVTVDIAPGDVDKGDEHHLYLEGTDKRRPVVHLLDVEIDHARSRVLVLRAHTANPKRARRGEDAEVKPVKISAFLDDDSVRKLIALFGPGAAREQSVLARVHPERTGDSGPRLGFVLVPPRAAPEGGDEPGLRAGDSLYLVAGRIVQTANDRLLPFTLPGLTAVDGDPLQVTVSRRHFSYRESALRLAREKQYENAKMLVRLTDRGPGGDNHWYGATKQAPERRLDILRSHLLSRGGDCFAVVTDTGKQVEVRPGVLFPVAGMHTPYRLAPRSVVRLRLHGTDGVTARQAIASEVSYLDERPRPAVVFPKDDFRTEQDYLKAGTRRGGFTVAGLPGISATAPGDLAKVLLCGDHPKIAGVVREGPDGGRSEVRLVPLGQGQGGVVSCRKGQAVRGARVLWKGAAGTEPAASDTVVPWAQLSFMDVTAEEIAAACHDRGWLYHDTRTRTWLPARKKYDRPWLRQPARSVEEPVFFSRTAAGWTLRHRKNTLRQFGFPAAELLEGTHQDSASRTRGSWVVAAGGRDSLWLELAPGRIAEVSAELLQFTDGRSLADLDCSLFSPGDLVQGRVEGGVNECGHLVLTRWRPGPRGAFAASAARRMLLPVDKVDEVKGALHLGEGPMTVRHPAARDVLDAHPAGGAVWLDDANTLTPLGESPVHEGDVVFVAASDVPGELRVLGLPAARVRLAPESAQGAWPPRTQWLREALAAVAAGTGWLLAKLGSVPMTVERVEAGAESVLTVSRRAQPRGTWPKGSVLAEPVADLGKGDLAMRSGSALIQVPVRALLRGLPSGAAAAPAAAAALVARGGLLRLHWDPKTATLTSGPEAGPQDRDRRETSVVPLAAVDTPQDGCLGLVCRDEQTQQLCWLPAGKAAWTRHIPGEVLLGHLRDVKHLPALREAPGAVTLCGHPPVAREYDRLEPGQLRHVRVVLSETAAPVTHAGDDESAAAADASQATDRCLVSVEPLGMLAEYTPADGNALPAAGETFMAEVSRLERGPGRTALRLVEQGSRLTVVDLPVWMSSSLGELYVPPSAREGGSAAEPDPAEVRRVRGGDGRGPAGHGAHRPSALPGAPPAARHGRDGDPSRRPPRPPRPRRPRRSRGRSGAHRRRARAGRPRRPRLAALSGGQGLRPATRRPRRPRPRPRRVLPGRPDSAAGLRSEPGMAGLPPQPARRPRRQLAARGGAGHRVADPPGATPRDGRGLAQAPLGGDPAEADAEPAGQSRGLRSGGLGRRARRAAGGAGGRAGRPRPAGRRGTTAVCGPDRPRHPPAAGRLPAPARPGRPRRRTAARAGPGRPPLEPPEGAVRHPARRHRQSPPRRHPPDAAPRVRTPHPRRAEVRSRAAQGRRPASAGRLSRPVGPVPHRAHAHPARCRAGPRHRVRGALAYTSISLRVMYPPGRAVMTTRTAVAGAAVTGTETTGAPSVPTGTASLASLQTPSADRACTLRLSGKEAVAPSRWKRATIRVRSRAFGRVKVIVSEGFLAVPGFQLDQAFSVRSPLRSRSAEYPLSVNVASTETPSSGATLVSTGSVTRTWTLASTVLPSTTRATPRRVTTPTVSNAPSGAGSQVTGRTARPPCEPTPTTVGGSSGRPPA